MPFLFYGGTGPDMNDYTIKNLAKLLLGRGLLKTEQAQRLVKEGAGVRAQILKDQTYADSRRVPDYVVTPAEVVVSFEFRTPDGRVLDEDIVMPLVAEAAGREFVKPDPLDLDLDLIASTMSRPFARRHTCVPLRKEDGRTVIAVDDPFNAQFLLSLQDTVPGELEIVVSGKRDIQRIITEVYGFRSSILAAEKTFSDRFDLGNLEQLVSLRKSGEIEATDQPVINAVEYLLHYAFDQRASDIHIEPKREKSIVRLRIDGVLHNVYAFPKAVHAAFASRIKMLARMDISEKRRSQDGRIKTERGGREVELRVSSMSVAYGEKIVIRVFDPQALIQDLENVGFTRDELTTWRNFIGRPTGLILVTGPTGSGKTTTLYSTLKELAGPEVNLTTVEDPIEMVYEEFNQVAVQRRIDIDFAHALRTILRQDPDIIMIGEIRDGETARMATQAALTGHLVFSTLHTNDTASTVNRLLDLGVEPFLLSSTLVGVMAQRLVRRICPECKRQTSLTEDQIRLLDIKLPPKTNRTLPVHYGDGCVKCRSTGYFGRVAVFEMLEVEETIRGLIETESSAAEIRRAARANGMTSLRESAIKKLAQGMTTFEEVLSVSADS
jgi:general secretion pathway protein E